MRVGVYRLSSNCRQLAKQIAEGLECTREPRANTYRHMSYQPLLLESKRKPNRICQPLLWRGNVIRCHAAFESPAAVFPHEDIVVAAGLRDYRLAVGGRRDKGPTRPCSRAVAVSRNFEV